MALDGGFRLAELEYEHPDLGDDPREDPHAIRDVWLARRIGETIQSLYGGHPFLVEVSHAQGVAMISLPMFTGPHRRWVVRLDELAGDPGLKSVMRIAGEILERYNLPRNTYNHSQFMAALNARPIGPGGDYGFEPL